MHRRGLYPLIGVLLGMGLFIHIFGINMLYPQHLDWLLQTEHSDSAQHLIGWEFFRYEPWRFPLGVIQSYGFPVPTSIVYTDSIPLMALLAKSCRVLLPEHFQYFGLWLMLCFGLQGFFALLLCKKIHHHLFTQILMTSFFVISPILLDRTIEHQALAAQWTILAGLWLYLRAFDRNTCSMWIVLTTCTLMIHAYLMMMVLVLECAYLYKNIRHERQIHWHKWGLFLLVQSFIIGLIGWVIGYFVIDTPQGLGLDGYSVNSMNILAPILPTSGAMALPNHWSYFLKTLSLPLLEQGDEGFNYLGLGMLCLILCAFCCCKNHVSKLTFETWKPLCCVCVLLTLYAISNRVMFGSHVLYNYHLLPYFQKITYVFRAPGRFFWPVYDVLMLGAFLILSRQMKVKALWVLLCLGLLVQWIDLSNKFQELHHYFGAQSRSFPTLPVQLTAEGGKKYKHLVIFPFTQMPQVIIPHFHHYLHFAALHQMTVNLGYFARADYAAIRNANRQQLQRALQGQFQADTLYLTTEPSLERLLKEKLFGINKEQMIRLQTIKPT